MSEKSKKETNREFYIHFGILTSAFAHLEGDLRVLIAGVAFGENSVTATTFLDRSNFAGNIDILGKLAREHPDHEPFFLEIAKLTNEIRITRNLFIHGLWTPKTYGEENGAAVVQTLKVVYEKTDASRSWETGVSQKFSKADFAAIDKKIQTAVIKIEELCERLEKHEDMDFGYFLVSTRSWSHEPINLAPNEGLATHETKGTLTS